MAESVEMWFDPTCPWAWMTSRWLVEVTRVRDVEVSFHLMSLAVLNEGRELSDDYAARMRRAWGPARVMNAARVRHGEQVLGPLYEAVGRRFHPDGRGGDPDSDREVLTEALVEVGLPADLVSFMDDDALDDSLRATHAEGIARVGEDVGTPIVAFGSVAFFGPVVSPAPKGEAAGRLWDGCLLVAGTDGFFEIKRTRTVGPQFE